MRHSLIAIAAATLLTSSAPANWTGDTPDLAAIYKIKDEGFAHSQVMEIESYLTDVYGPRLTNSPNVKAARDWTISTMTSWGLANVHAEVWGPFGRGWSNEHFSAQMISPRPYFLIAYPEAWTPGTNDPGAAPITADAVLAQLGRPSPERYARALAERSHIDAQIDRISGVPSTGSRIVIIETPDRVCSHETP